MIFLTVGSELPFDRLVRATDEWCAAQGRSDVYGQLADLGADGYKPAHFEWCAFMSPDDYERRYRTADLIVGHAGMGSIITAMTYAKPIVIMPRRAAQRETRNDHQVATAERLGARAGIFVATDEVALPKVLDRVLSHGMAQASVVPLSPFAEPRLLRTIRDFVLND